MEILLLSAKIAYYYANKFLPIWIMPDATQQKSKLDNFLILYVYFIIIWIFKRIIQRFKLIIAFKELNFKKGKLYTSLIMINLLGSQGLHSRYFHKVNLKLHQHFKFHL